jgi:hypothetical protein
MQPEIGVHGNPDRKAWNSEVEEGWHAQMIEGMRGARPGAWRSGFRSMGLTGWRKQMM